MTETIYYDIHQKATTSKYTSLAYFDYEEYSSLTVLSHNQDFVTLIDQTVTPALIHFATDNFELVISQLKELEGDFQINFVPHEFKDMLEEIGFLPWAEFIDYFNYDLAKTAIGPQQYNDIIFLEQSQCEAVSLVSQKCANQSRGFAGETSIWFSDWIKENEVIIDLQNNQIAGFCCVSIYNEGTTLWIREIAVDPHFQGKGIGKKLIEQAICYGLKKGAVKSFLSADLLNDTAIKLYCKYGFQPKDQKGELQMRKMTVSCKIDNSEKS